MRRRDEAQLNMGRRALEFSQANPSSSPGYATALKQLADENARATGLAEEQRRGFAEVRTATVEKDKLRRTIRRSHLVHLAGVAQRAAIENPELAQKFDLSTLPKRGLAFRAAARSMIELAEQQKELLSRYGLVEEALQNARKDIDQLDGFVDRAAEGRRVHVGASAGLKVAAKEIVHLVRILDGFNRSRFESDPNLLAGWISASNVIGPAVSGDAAEEGQTGGEAAPAQTPPTAPPSSGSINPAA